MKSLLSSSLTILAFLAISFAIESPRSSARSSTRASRRSSNGDDHNTEEKATGLQGSNSDKNAEATQEGYSVEDFLPYDFLDDDSTNSNDYNTTEKTRSDLQERGSKKEDKLMSSIYMGMMLTKAFFNVVFMFVNQIFQLKNFGFQLLNAIINVARFIIQYQQHVSQQQKQQVVKVQAQDWYGATGLGYNQGSYAYYQPSAYGSQQTAHAHGHAADRVQRFAIVNAQAANLHANNLAYAAYANNANTAASNVAYTSPNNAAAYGTTSNAAARS